MRTSFEIAMENSECIYKLVKELDLIEEWVGIWLDTYETSYFYNCWYF
jgi:hypothetical protein